MTTKGMKPAGQPQVGPWLRAGRLLVVVLAITGCMLFTLCGANGGLIMALTSYVGNLPQFTSSFASTDSQFIVDQPAPPLSLPNLDGWPVTLSEQRGQVVLLAFWATWCAPCLTELDHIQTLYDARMPGLVILTICQESHDTDYVRAFVREKGWDFPVLHDAELVTIHRYQVRAVPRTLLLDREGVVRYDHLGYGPGYDVELDAAINTLLSASRRGEE